LVVLFLLRRIGRALSAVAASAVDLLLLLLLGRSGHPREICPPNTAIHGYGRISKKPSFPPLPSVAAEADGACLSLSSGNSERIVPLPLSSLFAQIPLGLFIRAVDDDDDDDEIT